MSFMSGSTDSRLDYLRVSHVVSHCSNKFHFWIAVAGMVHWRSHQDKGMANVGT